MPRYLMRHGAGWKFIRAVPHDLHRVYGRKFFTYYIGAASTAAASEAARKLAVYADETVATLKRLSADEQATIAAAGGLTKWWNSPLTHVDRLFELATTIEPDPDQPEAMQEADEAAAFRASRALARMQPQIATRQRIVAKLNTLPTPEPKMFALIEAWERLRKPTRKTAMKARLYFRRLVDVTGDIEPRAVTRADVIRYRDALAANPKTAQSTNKHLDMLKSVFGVSLSEGLTTINPAHGIKPPKPDHKHSDGKRGLTAEETRAIFAALRGETDDFQWIVKLLAYQGARSGEIAQLRCKDVRPISGVLAIDINDQGSKRVKNKSSHREIPVHPAIKREFAAFVEAVRAKHGDDTWLWTAPLNRCQAD